MQALYVVVEELNRRWEKELLYSIRGMLAAHGFPSGDEMFLETGSGYSNIAAVAETIRRNFKPGTRILSLEPHCADQLTVELYGRTEVPEGGYHLGSFVPDISRFRGKKYRAFDLDHTACGRLAVTMLGQLVDNPALPPFASYIRSPGWTPIREGTETAPRPPR